MGVEQVVVRKVRRLAEDEERRDAGLLERCRLGGQVAVGGDDRRLRVAIAIAVVLALRQVAAELLLDELLGARVAGSPRSAGRLPRRRRRTRAPSGILGGVERDRGRDVDRRVEQDEPRDELRGAGCKLEREAAAEGVAHETGRLGTDRVDDRVEMSVEIPRRLVGRRAVAEEVGREDVAPGERSASFAKCRPWLVTPCRHTTRSAPGSPPRARASPSPSASSDSGTISVRCSSRSFTSDQMTVPTLSMRNVPRCGAPFRSLKTP